MVALHCRAGAHRRAPRRPAGCADPDAELCSARPAGAVLVGVALVGLLYEALAAQSRAACIWRSALAGLVARRGRDVRAVVLGRAPRRSWADVAADRFAVVSTVILVIAAAFGLLLGTHYLARGGGVARRVLPAAPVRHGRHDADRGRRRPDRGVPGARDPVAVALRADRVLGAGAARGRDEVLPARRVLVGVLPLRRRDGLRRDRHDELTAIVGALGGRPARRRSRCWRSACW